MDLRNRAPRSPYEKLGGVHFLPRTIDKMRAELAGTPGAYYSRRGASVRVFQLFGIDADTFAEIVRQNPTDEGVWEALGTHKKLTPAEVDRFNGGWFMRLASAFVSRTETRPT